MIHIGHRNTDGTKRFSNFMQECVFEIIKRINRNIDVGQTNFRLSGEL